MNRSLLFVCIISIFSCSVSLFGKKNKDLTVTFDSYTFIIPTEWPDKDGNFPSIQIIENKPTRLKRTLLGAGIGIGVLALAYKTGLLDKVFNKIDTFFAAPKSFSSPNS